MTLNKKLFEALELLIDNITPEEWERLPEYVEQQVMLAFNEAKDAEEANV